MPDGALLVSDDQMGDSPSNSKPNITSFYGSSRVGNGKGALSTPETLLSSDRVGKACPTLNNNSSNRAVPDLGRRFFGDSELRRD
eukprot:613135-Prorocentrum_minimum.AAC.1